MKKSLLLFIVLFSPLTLADDSQASVSGYVDVQAQWGRGQLELQQNSFYPGQPGFGFAVYKGAFEFQHKTKYHQMHIDIPFQQTETNPETTNNLDLAKERAQAYLSGQPNTDWSWKFGQFDTPWGYEGNDTNTIVFRNLGIIYNATPNTNTGLFVTRHYTPSTQVSLFLGNSNQYSKQSIDKKLEQGVQLEINLGGHFVKLGVLFNQRKGKYTLSSRSYDYEQGALVDLQMGHRVLNKLIIMNAIYIHPDNEYVLHKSQVTKTKPTHGLMLEVPLVSSTQTKWAVRGEWLQNDRSNQFVQSAAVSGNDAELFKVSLGQQHQLDPFVKIKASVDYFKLNVGENGRDNHWIEGAIAAVYEF